MNIETRERMRKIKMKKRIATVRLQKTLCGIAGIALAVILLSNANKEHDTVPVVNFEHITQNQDTKPEIKYFTYEVQNGDNIWNIAKKFKLDGYNMDNMMLHIRTVNKLPNNSIYMGKTLQIPYYE